MRARRKKRKTKARVQRGKSILNWLETAEDREGASPGRAGDPRIRAKDEANENRPISRAERTLRDDLRVD